MNYVDRAGWGAAPPKGKPTPLREAKPGMTVHYNGPAMKLTDHARCAAAVKSIQRFHQQSRGWDDIAYSFCVCPHGSVFEARGWGVRTAANGTNVGNNSDHAVMLLIGDGEPLTEQLKQAVVALVLESDRRYGRKTPTRPHSFWKGTACPGVPASAWVREGMPTSADNGPIAPPQGDTDMTASDWARFQEILNDAFELRDSAEQGRYSAILAKFGGTDAKLDAIEQRLARLEQAHRG